ncbi:hypothetical protein ACJW30_01G189700 [Castanea mollissima]
MWPKESSVIFGDNSISISLFKNSPFKFSNSVSFNFYFCFLSVPGRFSSLPKYCGLGYVCFEGLLGDFFSMRLGIRFSELKTVVEGDNSEILCCGFSIRVEFEEEWEVGFLGFVGWVFNLICEFEIGF